MPRDFHLSNASGHPNPSIRGTDRSSDSRGGRPKADADRAAGERRWNPHGGEHVGGLDLAGRAGGARGHRHPVEIEGDDGGLGLQPGHAQTASCWAAARPRRRKSPTSGVAARRPCFQPVAQAPHPRALRRPESGLRGRGRRAEAGDAGAHSRCRRGAALLPAACDQRIGRGSSSSRDQRADALGAPILCPERVRRSAPSALMSTEFVPRPGPHRRAGARPRHAPGARPRQSVEQRRSRCWRASARPSSARHHRRTLLKCGKVDQSVAGHR